MINRKSTYANINIQFGKLSTKQVEGFEAFFDEWDKSGLVDIRQLAYILATVWHEVKKTMQPIEEDGKGKGRRYGQRQWFDGKFYMDIIHIFFGRGHTQNTWRDIYLKLTKVNKNGWDFVNHPELLLQMKPSVWATFHAMTTGLYTGRKLGQYFNSKVNDPIGARKIINGKDKAILIEGHYKKFLKSIVTT
jgi:putative chitinase